MDQNSASKSKKRKTVGAISLDLMQKEPEVNTVVDQQRAMQENYLKELSECVSTFEKKNPNRDFFVAVLTKDEKLMPNVFRNYFVPRFTCPVPNYDQSVFRYHHKTGDLEFVWCVPCRKACIYLKDNALSVPADERDLLNMVFAFSDGSLYALSNKMNEELLSPVPLPS